MGITVELLPWLLLGAGVDVGAGLIVDIVVGGTVIIVALVLKLLPFSALMGTTKRRENGGILHVRVLLDSCTFSRLCCVLVFGHAIGY